VIQTNKPFFEIHCQYIIVGFDGVSYYQDSCYIC